MKKTCRILILLIAITLLSGCDFLLKPEETNVKQEVFTEYETMVDALLQIEKVSDISDYLFLWAQTNGLPVERNSQGTVVIESLPKEGPKGDLVTIECEFSMENRQEDLRSIAFALAFLRNYDSSEPLRLLLVPYAPQNHFGAKKVSKDYLKEFPFIKLNTKTPDEILLSEAGLWNGMISRSLKTKAPGYKFAYEISLEGFNSFISFEEGQPPPNSIKILGNFLATCKSNGMILEIAELNGNTELSMDVSTYYSSSSAILVITQNDVRTLQRLFRDLKDQVDKQYLKAYPEISLSLLETELPVQVFSHEDSDRMISFLYTIFDGCYDSHYDAMSLLTDLSIYNNRFQANLLLWSHSQEVFQEMSRDFEVISNLNEMNHTLKEEHPGWQQNPESPWVQTFLQTAKKQPKSTLMTSSLVTYHQRNPHLEMVSFGVDLKNCEKQWKVLSSFLDQFHSSAL